MFRRLSVALALAGLAVSPAWSAGGLKSDFLTALSGFQKFPVASETGLALGDAAAAGRTFPLASLKISNVSGGSFTLTRKLLYVPATQKERTYQFRLTGGTADVLQYEVTQAATADSPALLTHCQGKKTGQGRFGILIRCFRPEVEALGSLAQPSFTFLFKADPTFGIQMGEGLDNIFTVDAGSDYTPTF